MIQASNALSCQTHCCTVGSGCTIKLLITTVLCEEEQMPAVEATLFLPRGADLGRIIQWTQVEIHACPPSPPKSHTQIMDQ